MKANTALALVLSGISLVFLIPQAPSRQRRRIAFILASLVELVGLGTLCEYLFGLNLRLDQLLFMRPQTSGRLIRLDECPPFQQSRLLPSAPL